MDIENFKVGDVVRMKSEGPNMTIQDFIGAGRDVPKVECQWFIGDRLQTGIFSIDALELVEERDRSGEIP